jgi:hypothetical protein
MHAPERHAPGDGRRGASAGEMVRDQTKNVQPQRAPYTCIISILRVAVDTYRDEAVVVLLGRQAMVRTITCDGLDHILTKFALSFFEFCVDLFLLYWVFC